MLLAFTYSFSAVVTATIFYIIVVYVVAVSVCIDVRARSHLSACQSAFTAFRLDALLFISCH